MLEQIRTLQMDRYVKKLDTITTCKLFVFAQLMQIKSLTDVSLHLSHQEDLQKELNLDSISTSQLSRKLREIDPAVFHIVFQDLVRQISKQLGMASTRKHLGCIHLIDSSTISMALSQYRWAEFRTTKAGVKIHLRLAYWGETVYPDEAILTPAKPADKKQLDRLIVRDPDALNVFDRGYLDYRAFDRYCREGIRFVTRLKANADIRVVEETPVQSDSGVRRDAIVRLGNPYTYQMEHELRLIETMDTEGNRIVILTNDFAMKVDEISDAYRWRWQIELFFKWMKQHLKLKTCYGKSRNAVYGQIRIALIVFCLLLLMQLKAAHRGRLLRIMKYIRFYWAKAYAAFLKALHRKPRRTSKGRRSWDSERIFREILQQYEMGEAAYIDELTYDPII